MVGLQGQWEWKQALRLSKRNNRICQLLLNKARGGRRKKEVNKYIKEMLEVISHRTQKLEYRL